MLRLASSEVEVPTNNPTAFANVLQGGQFGTKLRLTFPGRGAIDIG